MNYKQKARLMKYNLSEKEFMDMLDKQDYRCAICEKKLISPMKGRRVALDHCHRTNVVRGVLCTKCNLALGLFDDSIKLLSKALNYLKKFESSDKYLSIYDDVPLHIREQRKIMDEIWK